MSLVKYYQCDICNKRCKQSELHHYTKKHTYFPILGGSQEIINDFDMCENCMTRITRELKKECT